MAQDREIISRIPSVPSNMLGDQGRRGDDVIVREEEQGTFRFPYPIVASRCRPFILLGKVSNRDGGRLTESGNRRSRSVRRAIVDDKDFQNLRSSRLLFVAFERL
jgi:hypothetical protein